MNNYILKPDFEPQNRYENALKALLEAGKAIEPLTDMEKQSLLQDYIKYKITGGFYDMVKHVDEGKYERKFKN